MTKKFFSLNIKQVMIIVTPLAVVALFTIFSFSMLLGVMLEKIVVDKISSSTELIANEGMNSFESALLSLDTLTDSIGNETNQNRINSLLKIFVNNNPQCIQYYYGDAISKKNGGAFTTSDDWVAPADFDHVERGWFKSAVAAKGKSCMGDPYISHPSEALCVSFSRAIYGRNGQLSGVVGTDIDLTKLTQLALSVNLSESTKAYIVDKNGLFITNEDPEAILKKNYFDGTVLKDYTAEEYLNGEPKAFIQKNYFFSVHQIGETDWFVVMDGKYSDFTSKLSGVFNTILIITIVLIFGCLLFFAFILNRTNAKEKNVSEKLIAETQNLAVSAKETAATAQDQSAAVKEIVTTMEDNTALSEDISQKIKDVSAVAGKTNGDVAEGVSYIEENVRQLQLIADTNLNTINGIKSLGDKIENIWDIVTLINSVADQAKIIAFNAELEASSAGEAGKNFHIVATEIRRLADGIIDGTKEIKEKINEIQQSSDSLILASENGTETISQGVESAKNLEARFNSIKNASEITAESAEKITAIIQQQAIASEQILVTLKQIASGVENFTAATEHISKTSQNLKTIASDLDSKKEEEEA
ncbi:methyl-accepting chemotaxis protein [Treponema sp.]|uniref:methyl-accepting chemotaxis protein n=1 Tax=Treponema sp. TaxID=166 RepID=UPI00298EB58B|nr:methyl-accepting chemotaxis protein [Treponema sp.]MCR5612648.1 hypothetical protein [Treponema sp.]